MIGSISPGSVPRYLGDRYPEPFHQNIDQAVVFHNGVKLPGWGGSRKRGGVVVKILKRFFAPDKKWADRPKLGRFSRVSCVRAPYFDTL